MKRPFRLSRRQRAVLRAFVEVVKPRWDDYDPPIEDTVVAKMERDMGRFPPLQRRLMLVLLWLLQWGGPLARDWPVPFTRLSPERRTRRVERLLHARGRFRYLVPKILKTHALLICYGTPEVERYLGIERHAWRANRRRFRAALVAADGDRVLPAPPAALGTTLVSPQAYLDPATTDAITAQHAPQGGHDEAADGHAPNPNA